MDGVGSLPVMALAALGLLFGLVMGKLERRNSRFPDGACQEESQENEKHKEAPEC